MRRFFIAIGISILCLLAFTWAVVATASPPQPQITKPHPKPIEKPHCMRDRDGKLVCGVPGPSK